MKSVKFLDVLELVVFGTEIVVTGYDTEEPIYSGIWNFDHTPIDKRFDRQILSGEVLSLSVKGSTLYIEIMPNDQEAGKGDSDA